MKSQISVKAECYICRRFLDVETPYPLEKHHFIHGRGLRQLAEADGLYAWICTRHHNALHNDPTHPYDEELKRIAQETYLQNHTREEFLRRYGKLFD